MNFDYKNCTLCPRMCHVDRTTAVGYCKSGSAIRAARAALHHWEEPCISGTKGSGAVFFSGCTLRCCFCQNYQISSEGFGKELTPRELAGVFLRLQDEGAHNIDLITATQYLPSVLPALDLVRHQLTIPVIYNCGGYERVETIETLKDYVDIYLPDIKYYSPELSARYSGAADYFDHASAAITAMAAQTGPMVFEDGILKKGVILRHMVLPGARQDSIKLLHWISENLPKNHYMISLLSQYTPFYHSADHPEINRRLTTFEYQKVVDEAIALGLDQGYMQERSSAKEEYTPDFDLSGI